MSSPLELVIAEAIVRGLRNFDREDEAIGGSGRPEFVPAPTPIWNAKLLGRSAENYIPLLTDFGLQLTRSETRRRLTLIQRSPFLTLNPTNASPAQLDEAASHFLSIGVPSPQRSGGTVSRSDLVEGTMSQTGAKTHHSDADEASNVIEERLRLIIDTIPTIVWRKLPDGSADFLNQHFREYTGLSLEDGLGWGWMNAFHPDDRLMEEWRAALAAGKPFEKEARLLRADGQYRWFVIRAVPLRDEEGNIVNWYGTSIDIEDLKRAEDRVRLSIDTIPTMAWTVRSDGAVDFVNRRWLDYTGLTLEEEVADPTRPIHPEDLPRVVEKWLVDMAAGGSSEDEMRLRRADGEYRWFLVRTAPLRDEQGNVVKWYGVSIDIEDRKRAESQSRTLIDAIPQQIWSGPPDGTLDYCNLRWRSYMGLELEDLRGDGWQTMLHPDDRDRVLQAWHESVVNGTPYEQEERHRGADGTYRWFLARGVPLRNAEGRIVRWYSTNTDIEDRKQAEEELRRLSGQLLRSQDEERRRIARELHDSTGQNLVALATMVSQVRGAIPPVNRKLRGLLSECKALAERCMREVRTLSYVLHPPVLEQAGLGDAIRDYVDGFAKRSGIHVELELSPRLGRMARDVEIALFRVVQESLTNIQRHSGSQQAKIRIHRNSNLMLEISDRGHGTSVGRQCEEAQPHFVLGVGIPSMQERVKLIGGRLHLDSSSRGTTVRVTIPLEGKHSKRLAS
jgi:PAS domain S-box-containing protein